MTCPRRSGPCSGSHPVNVTVPLPGTSTEPCSCSSRTPPPWSYAAGVPHRWGAGECRAPVDIRGEGGNHCPAARPKNAPHLGEGGEHGRDEQAGSAAGGDRIVRGRGRARRQCWCRHAGPYRARSPVGTSVAGVRGCGPYFPRVAPREPTVACVAPVTFLGDPGSRQDTTRRVAAMGGCGYTGGSSGA